jgi:hypothetical protein
LGTNMQPLPRASHGPWWVGGCFPQIAAINCVEVLTHHPSAPEHLWAERNLVWHSQTTRKAQQ